MCSSTNHKISDAENGDVTTQYFFQKVAQIFGDLLGYFEKVSLL